MSVSVKTCFWERLRAWRSSRSCATTPRTTGSLYRSFFRRMVQRYVKFGNFRSPVAASFAALQKVRSAPPVTGFLSSTFCCSLSAVRCPLSAVRCLPLAACCLCLLFARRLLFATLRLPPQPAITTRRPQTAAARVDSSPANPFLSGYALNRSHMCAERRSMLFCLASDVVETEFLFIFVQINKGKQLFIPLADRGNFIRRLFEPGMVAVGPVLCLDFVVGQAWARDDFPVPAP